MRFLMLNWRDPKNPLAGGAERVSLAYMNALAERGHEVFWYANDFEGGEEEERYGDITLVRGGGKGSSVLKAIQWYRRQKPFDLVIDQHHGIPWYAPWWCKTNCVAYIHEILGPIWSSFYAEPWATIGRWQERWTLARYRKVPFWTPSQSTKAALMKCGVRNIEVIPNGCDTVPLMELPPKPIAHPLRLIAVSRLAPNKRVDHALTVVRLLINKGVPVRLTIVGNGECEQQLRRTAAALELTPYVEFAGRLPEAEKNHRLQEAHVLLHTSVREGWGLNVIEANALGTPAVVYPVAGLVDSTIHDHTGKIAKSESPDAIADELFNLARRPEQYEELRTNAWQRAQKYQWSQVLPQAADWLESQASKRR